ncbi:MAG: DUF3311 domain-containing protein [Candidatus Eremiobacteraeota bacterium]|uniref:DUF3311 domain-containing protein n=1 Tax=mine drainage metagenome TaxID=410659 RepID=E6PDH3_9ZZZZ|nr:DUF3311 domain-containing protein [Candidatus Eremiobacteraeota bacterium]NNM92274.1 DUF3311 domain-containing protein [Candidatus Eremiobacteraeota bacterium]NNM99005.1 DUF3311 domain-containing protein [Candidatus Eremiobacteraeota bacterium]
MARRAWYWLLALPFIALLDVPIYNRIDPRWDGIPFFYWYQLAWVVLTAALLGIVYLATRERAR